MTNNEWSEFVRSRRGCVDAELCAAIRRRIAGTDVRLAELADGDFSEHSRTAISRHARGECGHDVGAPPVEWVAYWKSVEER